MSARRKRLRWVLRAVVVLVSLAAALGAFEAYLRIADPIGLNYEVEHLRYRNNALRFAWDKVPPDRIDLDGTLYRHKPSLDIDIGSYRLQTNALGFRGPEISKQKPPGTFRILVLGDSVSYGTGVNDEVTFLRRWEQTLNESGDRHFEVVNTGHPMYDTSQELALFRDEGLALDPDLVLLVYVVNDIEPTRDVVEQALLGKAPDPAEVLADPGDGWTRLADIISPVLPATARLLQLQSDAALRFLTTQPEGTEYVPERFGKGPRGWPRSQTALLAIRDLCRERRIPFVLLDNTMPAVRALPQFCRDNEIPYHELRFTPAELELPIRNSMLDSHSNARGHELLLGKLRALEPQLPLPR
ncbi:MAG: SGNH/GDSL hydrolase family protein [Planctomycetes bacterium]|nr:SGNH/GDSL hydrolase family protein [Planctomycetota bacterium]